MSAVQSYAIFLFWGCLGLILYSYGVYALLITGLSRAFGRRSQPPPLPDERLPTVSLLVAAYNEEAVIAERVRNALALEYPPGKLEIVIGSDGSSDRTVEIVRQFRDPRVRLLDFPNRRGKASVLNAAMSAITSEIVLLSDANTHTDASAARNLVRWFQDPTVGCVCGKLVLTDLHTSRNVDGLYWRYETFLKQCEGRLGALLGSNGAIYALRRELYRPIPSNTIVDDLVIPLLAKLRAGCSIVYDCKAVAREETAPDIGSEFRRRTRIGAGGFQAIAMLWRLLSPRYGWTAFAFLSHKTLRWLCPFCLIAVFATNLLLVGRLPYQWALAGQLAFYAASLVGGCLPVRAWCWKPLRLVAMFTTMNAALLVGFFRWLRGGQSGTWYRTARTAEAAVT